MPEKCRLILLIRVERSFNLIEQFRVAGVEIIEPRFADDEQNFSNEAMDVSESKIFREGGLDAHRQRTVQPSLHRHLLKSTLKRLEGCSEQPAELCLIEDVLVLVNGGFQSF